MNPTTPTQRESKEPVSGSKGQTVGPIPECSRTGENKRGKKPEGRTREEEREKQGRSPCPGHHSLPAPPSPVVNFPKYSKNSCGEACRICS